MVFGLWFLVYSFRLMVSIYGFGLGCFVIADRKWMAKIFYYLKLETQNPKLRYLCATN
jgi:hypothetical protein